MNGAGWPAYPFQAGKVQWPDLLEKKLPETAGFQVLYDLDLAKLSNTLAYEVNNAGTLKARWKRWRGSSSSRNPPAPPSTALSPWTPSPMT
ncbi:hypothetical protein [Verrucomicrobium spinosum]|uniref:hypothetical protein n=1 Tax=Verrucomicrobium spinosum TaxID=2736 RepID=UPI000AAB4827|nr:hypothetical protein [Verrucomicrobium spinosum]